MMRYASFAPEIAIAAAGAYRAGKGPAWGRERGLSAATVRNMARSAAARGLVPPLPPRVPSAVAASRQSAMSSGTSAAEYAAAAGITIGAARSRIRRAERSLNGLERPAPPGFRDTGLRIIDSTGEMIYPDGRRTPAPPLLWKQYVIDSRTSRTDILRLLVRDGPAPVAPAPGKARHRIPRADADAHRRTARAMYRAGATTLDAHRETGVTMRTIQRWWRQFDAEATP